MKFLDLNGLKHLLKRVVKYDKGSTSNVTVSTLYIDSLKPHPSENIPEKYVPSITFPDIGIMSFGTSDCTLFIDNNGLHAGYNPELYKQFPLEGSTLRDKDLFLVVASILHTLKEKGIMQ